jgi:hypothetical protein
MVDLRHLKIIVLSKKIQKTSQVHVLKDEKQKELEVV